LEYSVAQLRERIALPVIKQALAVSWYVYDLEGFLAHFTASAGWADAIARQGATPLNTDDRTLLEYRFAKTVGSASPFSVEAIRKRLAELNYHRLPLSGDAVDWNVVELRRQEFNVLFGTDPSAELLSDREDIVLAEALAAYKAGDYARVIDRWPPGYREPTGVIQRMLLARAYAEMGRPDCLALIASFEAEFPIEAAGINAVFYSQLGNVEEVTKALERFYALLEKSPWLVTKAADAALIRTLQLAQADRAAAEKMYAILSRPLASYRYEYLRKRLRFYVARNLGTEKQVEALAALEPHVRWTADVLKPRAEVYAVVNHPYAARAQREWQQFLRDQPVER
jgi:hypothetical protein